MLRWATADGDRPRLLGNLPAMHLGHVEAQLGHLPGHDRCRERFIGPQQERMLVVAAALPDDPAHRAVPGTQHRLRLDRILQERWRLLGLQGTPPVPVRAGPARVRTCPRPLAVLTINTTRPHRRRQWDWLSG